MQVLSSTVSDALLMTKNTGVTETARFVDLFDKFFDCFNARDIKTGIKKRKPFLDPFKREDFRIDVSL